MKNDIRNNLTYIHTLPDHDKYKDNVNNLIVLDTKVTALRDNLDASTSTDATTLKSFVDQLNAIAADVLKEITKLRDIIPSSTIASVSSSSGSTNSNNYLT